MIGFGSTDVSLSGMGKGDGNLKLEYVINPSENPLIFDLLENNRGLLSMRPSSYGILALIIQLLITMPWRLKREKFYLVNFLNLLKILKGKIRIIFKRSVVVNRILITGTSRGLGKNLQKSFF